MKHTLYSHAKQVLNWSERYTKTDMTYLASGSFWLLFGQAVNFLGTLVLVWFFANLLPKEAYGEYRFFIAAAAIFALAALPGMNIAITRAVAQGHDKTIIPAIREKMRWGLIGTVIAGIGSCYYALQGNFTYAGVFLFLGLLAPFVDALVLYPHYLRGKHDAKHETQYRNAQRIFVVLVTVLTLFLTKNIVAILAVYVLSTLVADAFFQWRTLRLYSPNGDIDEEAIRYGKRLSLVTGIRLGAQYLDKIVLWYMTGPAQLATYVIATAVPQEGSSALGRINYLALPKMATQKPHVLQRNLLYKVFVFVIATIPITVGYIVCIPYLFAIFFPQYTDAILFSQIASLAFLLVPFGLLVQYFHATANTRALSILTVVEPIILISLYVTLIPLFGIMGVIVASLTKGVLSAVITLVLFAKDGPRLKAA